MKGRDAANPFGEACRCSSSNRAGFRKQQEFQRECASDQIGGEGSVVSELCRPPSPFLVAEINAGIDVGKARDGKRCAIGDEQRDACPVSFS
jgi:hypothetical protein